VSSESADGVTDREGETEPIPSGLLGGRTGGVLT
jgi:hypothetical protein